ncbi:vignain-like [Eutrema salsugineum]|uniref:vignain-like n=1 Tax=Eutrema salsugineum TaxID=72664 RepID=UPI000CED4A6D|nr:vignain-like [Eutrema salsugineum]
MDGAKLGAKRNKQNAQAQAKEQAMKKAAEAGSSSNITNELTFQQIFGIETIRKDWSSGVRQIIGIVMDQGLRDICWAICFARLVQALYNMEHPNDPNEFSINDLIGYIKPNEAKGLGLANLKKAFKHIKVTGMLKMSTKGHEKAGDKGKRVKETFDLYEDVDASYIRQKLDRFPVALRLQIDVPLSDNSGQIYYLPKKKIITEDSRMHCLLLIGYGITRDGKLYFSGQNSWGVNWGCKGYIRIIIEEKCDIICRKE